MTGCHDVDPRGLGLRRSQLGDDAAGAATERDRDTGTLEYFATHSPCCLIESLGCEEALCTSQVEVELIDRGGLDDGGKLLEDRSDFSATSSDGVPRNTDDGRRRAESQGLGGRHRGADAVRSSLIRCGGDDTAPRWGSPHDQEWCLACTLRVFETSNLDEERVAVDEQNPSGW